jgi:DNA primase
MSNRDDIELVRSRTDILQVVAPYVSLKQSGKVWKGLCPFHNEKTPSFQVTPDLDRWYCFGQCGEGGDAIKFIQKVDNLTFPEALERLAIKAGVTLTRDPAYARETAPVGERDRLYAAMNAAVRYYLLSLRDSSVAKDYLTHRGMRDETIEQYQIGYAGGDWNALPEFMQKSDVPAADAVKAGILVAREHGGYYDKLRGRIVFPIVDVQNRTVGFGGRLIQAEEGRPKYLNSAETPLFSKSKTLYGLSKARKAITDLGEAIVVEGYLDVITCHQAGFLNVVATLGTSLTEEHALILGRLTRRVLLAFDSDAAGVKAAQRANVIFEAQEIDVRILGIPRGEDPDSLINSGRSEEFKLAIAGAVPVNECRLRQIIDSVESGMSERDLTTLIQREIVPILRATRSVIERERYVRLCAPLHPLYASGSSLAEEQIRQEVDGHRAWTSPRSYTPNRIYQKDGSSGSYARDQRRSIGVRQAAISVISGVGRAEDMIIQALVDGDPEHVALLQECLSPEKFVRPALAKLASTLLNAPGADGVREALDDQELASNNDVVEILLGRREPVQGINEKGLRDSLLILDRHAEEQTLSKLRALGREGNLQANALYTKIMRERKGARPV